MDVRGDFVRHVRVRDLLPSGSTVLIALSGGADSTALALLLHESRDDLGLDALSVAHLDHGLRPGSANEAKQVARWARERLGVVTVVERREITQAAGESPEEAARRVRYAFLQEAARACGASHIVTAHHADDQAETVLARILRGTGIDGLRGIPIRRAVSGRVPIVRPLLPFRRSDLRAFLVESRTDWIEDPTNEDGNERARLRHVALPALRKSAGRDPVPLLVRLSQNVADEQGIGPEFVARALLITDGDDLVIAAGFAELPAAAQAEALRRRVPALRGGAPLTRAETERLVASLAARSGPESGESSGDVSGVTVEHGRFGVRIVPDAPQRPAPDTCSAALPGETRLWDGLTLRVRIVDAGNAPFLERLACRDGTLELADADRLEGALTVRVRRDGDRLQPLGWAEIARLGHVLQRRAIPSRERARLPIVCDETGIVWATRAALADRVRVSATTTRIALLELVSA